MRFRWAYSRATKPPEKFLDTLDAKALGPVKLGVRKSKLKFTVFVMKDLDARDGGQA